ncbi:hypothetical protein FQN54_006086 [Arachnomyces sp. PD_36]|nr:hypothetical protein FQN54_006086 [Arachnomyces sp. PD_36]
MPPPTPVLSPTHSKWLLLALSSGAFAALNGLFAKLTTTELTSSISDSIAGFLSLPEGWVEVCVRGSFFALNLLSNITMWALFTRALTAANSTTRVSVMNTSANFLVTAVLGMVVFEEKVGGLWWLGAAGMGVGCIIVGMRDEGGKDGKGGEEGRDGGDDGQEEGVVLLGGERESEDESEDGEREGRKRRDSGEEEDLVRL